MFKLNSSKVKQISAPLGFKLYKEKNNSTINRHSKCCARDIKRNLEITIEYNQYQNSGTILATGYITAAGRTA